MLLISPDSCSGAFSPQSNDELKNTIDNCFNPDGTDNDNANGAGDDGKALQIAEMGGIPLDQAKIYLEMAAGSVEGALNLLFDSGDPAPPVEPASASSGFPAWYTVVWPEKQPVPEAWIDQGLAFGTEGASGNGVSSSLGIVQPKNGPCGVLAAFQGVVLSLKMGKGPLKIDDKVSDDDFVDAIVTILEQCAKDQSDVTLAAWKDAVGGEVESNSVPLIDLSAAVKNALASFQGKGGAVLLTYSVLLTRGVEQVRKDIVAGGGDPNSSLVLGSHWVCSMELISLILRGHARGNVCAFDALGARNEWGATAAPVGLLSTMSERTEMPMCDELVSPQRPVWILHGGDHFTLLFAATEDWPDTPLEVGKPVKLKMWHWNGLPPSGPRMAQLLLTCPRGCLPPAPKSAKDLPKDYKPVPGTIEGIVQALPADKKKFPDEWTKWHYEVVLAFDDPDVQGEERPPDVTTPALVPQGPKPTGPWRCTRCYATRYKTMYFKLSTGPTCENCGRTQDEAGWSIYLHHDELPPYVQDMVVRAFGPKILRVIRTKFPGAKVDYGDGQGPPAA